MQTVADYCFSSFMKTDNGTLTHKQKKKLTAMYQNDIMFKMQVAHYTNLIMYSYDLVIETPWGSTADKLGQGKFAGLNPRTMKYGFLINGCTVIRDGVMINGEKMPGTYAMLGYPTGNFNMNLDPLTCYCIGYNGIGGDEIQLYVPGEQTAPGTQYGMSRNKVRDPEGFVVWDNEARIAPMLYVIYFSLCITDAFRTLDWTRFWLKRPVIFTAPKELVNSINNVVSAMEINEGWTVENQSISKVGQATNMLNTNANGQNLKDVTSLIQWYDAQMLQLIGINSNTSMDKKGENLIKAEITVNDELEDANRQSALETKNRGFECGSEYEKFKNLKIRAVARGQKDEVNADDTMDGTDGNGDLRGMDEEGEQHRE